MIKKVKLLADVYGLVNLKWNELFLKKKEREILVQIKMRGSINCENFKFEILLYPKLPHNAMSMLTCKWLRLIELFKTITTSNQ